MKNKTLLLLLVIHIAGFNAHAQIITTIAGGGTAGLGDGGPAVSCELDMPYGTVVDVSGNLYIVDQGHNRIRKVNTSGIITTIAGTGGGGYNGDNEAATDATISEPSGVAVDASGNVYIADNSNHRIRKVNAAGIITTIAGTGVFGYNGDNIAATAATLYSPHGIAVDGSGNLYICDVLNNRLRKVNLTTGIITTAAGTGTAAGYGGDGGQATATDIGQPFGVTVDPSGNIFFADLSYNRVCKISTSGIISTIAGTGGGGYNGDNIAATAAALDQPFGVAVDANNNIYIADVNNNRVRKVNTSGIISTIVGTGTEGYNGDGEQATLAELYTPVTVTVDGNGNIFIADDINGRIRYIKNTLSVNTISNSLDNLNIYPNPSCTGDITVSILSGTDNEVQLFVTDLSGRKIKEITTVTNKLFDINLDVPDGIYFLSTATIDGSWKMTKRLIVSHCCSSINFQAASKIVC